MEITKYIPAYKKQHSRFSKDKKPITHLDFLKCLQNEYTQKKIKTEILCKRIKYKYQKQIIVVDGCALAYVNKKDISKGKTNSSKKFKDKENTLYQCFIELKKISDRRESFINGYPEPKKLK